MAHLCDLGSSVLLVLSCFVTSELTERKKYGQAGVHSKVKEYQVSHKESPQNVKILCSTQRFAMPPLIVVKCQCDKAVGCRLNSNVPKRRVNFASEVSVCRRGITLHSYTMIMEGSQTMDARELRETEEVAKELKRTGVDVLRCFRSGLGGVTSLIGNRQPWIRG